jgi:hypothetical protein
LQNKPWFESFVKPKLQNVAIFHSTKLSMSSMSDEYHQSGQYPSSVIDCIIKMGATSEAETAYHSTAPDFISSFQWGSYCSFFGFLCGVL